MLVSSSGGRSFDITPLDAPDTSSFGIAELGWTTDGRFVTFPNCDSRGGQVSCSGPSNFIEPDTGRVLSGPNAVTVAPIAKTAHPGRVPGLRHAWPARAQPLVPHQRRDPGRADRDRQRGVPGGHARRRTDRDDVPPDRGRERLRHRHGEVDDPESGINRTFTLLARGNLLGARILSASGIWMSINDLPFATGEFTMAIRRRWATARTCRDQVQRA